MGVVVAVVVSVVVAAIVFVAAVVVVAVVVGVVVATAVVVVAIAEFSCNTEYTQLETRRRTPARFEVAVVGERLLSHDMLIISPSLNVDILARGYSMQSQTSAYLITSPSSASKLMTSNTTSLLAARPYRFSNGPYLCLFQPPLAIDNLLSCEGNWKHSPSKVCPVWLTS